MKPVLLFLFAVIIAVSVSCKPKAEIDAKTEEVAVKAAEAWVKMIDAKQYAESWDAAAGYFKKAIAKEDWAKSIEPIRAPLGGVKSRTVKAKEYAKSLPGAPDGEYVVIQFETQFENKSGAIETITPMLDKDNVWRVSGYYIK